MNDLRFFLKTDSVHWAVAYYGCIQEALAIKGNPRFQAFFVTENPELKYLAREFPKSGNMGLELKLPITDEDFKALDQFIFRKQTIETQEVYGIVTDNDQTVPPAQCIDLMAGILQQLGIACRTTHMYPKPGKKMLLPFVDYDAIVEDSTMDLEQLEGFLSGLGIEEPNYLFLDELEPEQRLTALFADYSAGLFRLGSPYLSVVKSNYTDFDELGLVYPVLMRIETESNVDPRYTMSWSAVIPCVPDETKEAMTNKGRAWGVRAKVGFDHLKYLEEAALSRKNDGSN